MNKHVRPQVLESTEQTPAFTIWVKRNSAEWLMGQVEELPGCQTLAKDMMDMKIRIRDALSLFIGIRRATVADLTFNVGVNDEH